MSLPLRRVMSSGVSANPVNRNMPPLSQANPTTSRVATNYVSTSWSSLCYHCVCGAPVLSTLFHLDHDACTVIALLEANVYPLQQLLSRQWRGGCGFLFAKRGTPVRVQQHQRLNPGESIMCGTKSMRIKISKAQFVLQIPVKVSTQKDLLSNILGNCCLFCLIKG